MLTPIAQNYFEDQRPPATAVVEAVSVSGGSSVNLINVASGAGNVNLIQLAISAATADGNLAVFDSLISIYINGNVTPDIQMPVGLFFNCYGGTVASATGPTLFGVDNIGICRYSNVAATTYVIGVYRRMFIPYTNGIRITVANSSTHAAIYYTQVYYQQGTPPDWMTGTRRKRLYASVITPFTTSTSLAPFTPLNISGRGTLEGIHLFSVNGTAGNTWLEGNVSINLDSGSLYTVGGTEDFFLNQYYGASPAIANRTNRGGFIQTNATFVGAYRIFGPDEQMPFNSTAVITMNNGQTTQTPSPSSAQFGVATFYYLDH